MQRLVTLFLYLYAFSIPLETIALPVVGTPQRVLAIAIAGFWAATVLIERRGRLRFHKSWVWIGLFGLWTVASVFWAQDPSFAVPSAASIAQLALFSVVLMDFVDEGQTTSLLGWYSAGAISAAALALLTGQAVGHAERLTLPEVGPAHLAAVLWPGSLYLSYRAMSCRGLVLRAANIAAAGLLLVTVLRTGTRSAWVALVVAASVAAVRESRARWAALLTGTAIVAVILLVPEFYRRAITESLLYGGAGRIDIWKVGLLIVAAHPLWGVGIANFGPSFTTGVISRAGSFLYPEAIVPGIDAHNIFLQIAAELGVIGLGLFGTPLAIASAVGLQRRVSLAHRLVVTILIGYLAQGFFLPILKRKYFWFFIGLSLAAVRWSRSERRTDVSIGSGVAPRP